jgi:hypothetical protein
MSESHLFAICTNTRRTCVHFFFRRLYEVFSGMTSLDGGVFEFYCRYLDEAGFEKPPSFEQDILSGSRGMRKLMELINDDYVEMMSAYARLVGLSRIYEGRWRDRETKVETVRRFYDEREWRAISLRPNEENLKFTFEDIDLIMVDNRREKEDVVSFLTQSRPDMLQVPHAPFGVGEKILVADELLPNL